MFASLARRSTARSAVVQTQTRSGATLAELKQRIVSIGSIGKLTKAMKMVAVAKLRFAQEQLNVSRDFSAAITQAWPEPETVTVNPDNTVGTCYIVMTSDRGLCGGVNTQVIRVIRPQIRKNLDKDSIIFPIGDKGRTGLEREFSKYYKTSVCDVGKVKKLTFKQVAMTAEEVMAVPCAKYQLGYNKFINSSGSTAVVETLYPANIHIANTDIQSKYENEGDDEIYANFWEFRTACRLFNYAAESYASETGARMAAMSSSSKNAADMLTALSLFYNRQRQSKITSELTEIISGAAAAEEM